MEIKHDIIIKKKKLVQKLIAGTLAASIFVGTLAGCAVYKDNKINNDEDIKINQTQVQSPQSQQSDFYSQKFGDKTYLFANEEYLLDLIEKAMQEVDEEYVANGNKTVFNSKDREYSQFTKYDILGLLYTESSLRLLEIKDESNGIFNVQNYERFYGKDKAGVVYYGPGMMSEEAVKYIVEMDRLSVNNFDNHEFININGKKVKISYENINPYDYVLSRGAKTEAEIKSALEECLALNVKCIYITLNRFVKDNVKAGTHDAELKVLESYSELKNLTTEEKQIAYALIAYNNGPTVTRNAMLEGKLFEKNDNGEYVINVKYASKAMNYAKEFSNQFENELSK